jgi:hypothetical protein
MPVQLDDLWTEDQLALIRWLVRWLRSEEGFDSIDAHLVALRCEPIPERGDPSGCVGASRRRIDSKDKPDLVEWQIRPIPQVQDLPLPLRQAIDLRPHGKKLVAVLG